MVDELKREKAKMLRYKKPMAKTMNLEYIKDTLWEIREACSEVCWYVDSEDGSDSLVNALAGDESEAYEFKMAFSDLNAECEQMFCDLDEEWVPDCFDVLFVAAGAGRSGMYGYDTYEGDYFGISAYDVDRAEQDCRGRLKRMSKDELIDATIQCFNIANAFLGLQARYDSLKCAIDVLRGQNTGVLQAVKEIEHLYEDMQTFGSPSRRKSECTFEEYIASLPQEAWIA